MLRAPWKTNTFRLRDSILDRPATRTPAAHPTLRLDPGAEHFSNFIGFRGPAGRQGLGRIMKRGKETTDGRGYPNPYATRDRRARESRSVAERAERTTPPRTRRILEGSAKNSRAILPLRLSVQFSSVLQFTSVQFNSGRLKLSALSRQPRAVGLRSGC